MLSFRPDGGFRTSVSVVQRFRQNDPVGAAIGPGSRLYVTPLASGRVIRYG